MRRLSAALGAGLLAWAAAACSNTFLNATIESRVDTVTVGSLVGTPLTVPSGYSIDARRAVRTDSTAAFDFAYSILPGGRPVFLPLATLGLGAGSSLLPGFQASTETFDAIRSAPQNGYLVRDTIPVNVGDRWIVRSRIVCGGFGVPKYAKLQVLEIDDVNRLVRFQILVNQNCGFRDLLPGIPDN